ncbi:MAG: TIGR03960 family B12-binding radical SAM protein [Lachnospiraceae bacterium]|nr:TIGR03960 family B12-binding radical SAM protein [Lachnospiraceae bacterium]
MSRTCALPDRILAQIEKPARYTGNELNSIVKDKHAVAIRYAMCFPDVYEIGMSHLGIQIIYEQLNRREDTWCERVYSPWPDLMEIMKRDHIPLFALESQECVRAFDFLGITLQYELCYTNVLQILELSGIPFDAKERTWEDPIVMGGGPCTYNPEPIAKFFDLFYIGESEVMMDSLMDLYKRMRTEGAARETFLREAAKLPGIYVPRFYEVEYRDDGTILEMRPMYPDLPRTIERQVSVSLDEDPYPEKPIVPFIRPTQDRVTLEIMRGCIRGCRFCQAGMVYRPLRERSLPVLRRYAERMLAESGHEEISLSSLSSSDYRCLPELLTFLMDTFREEHVNISLPSLRIDNFSLDVMKKVQDVKKSSLTFAPEAGTQRLRDVINKGITEEDVLSGSLAAFKGGWNKVKLYFMLGLPTETEEDQKGIAHLAQEICEVYYDEIPKEMRQGAVDITVSTSFFVPKPFTPFEWAQMKKPEEYIDSAHVVKNEIRLMKNQKRIHYKWHDADGTELEGLLARGDRRVADVIECAYRMGCVFDAWTDFFDYRKWQAAYEACGLSIGFYTRRERPLTEVFPWDFIDIGVTKEFLKREWLRAVNEGKTTPNCRVSCSGCGAARYGKGVCFEKRGEVTA